MAGGLLFKTKEEADKHPREAMGRRTRGTTGTTRGMTRETKGLTRGVPRVGTRKGGEVAMKASLCPKPRLTSNKEWVLSPKSESHHWFKIGGIAIGGGGGCLRF